MCSWFAGASNGPTSWRTKYLHANAVNVLRPVLLVLGRNSSRKPGTWNLDSRWSHYHPHLTLIKLLCVLKCLFSICVRNPANPAPGIPHLPAAAVVLIA